MCFLLRTHKHSFKQAHSLFASCQVSRESHIFAGSAGKTWNGHFYQLLLVHTVESSPKNTSVHFFQTIQFKPVSLTHKMRLCVVFKGDYLAVFRFLLVFSGCFCFTVSSFFDIHDGSARCLPDMFALYVIQL